ncbi:hypothetical protein GWI33_023062 [Rhynchophorus ferrugineus]|uniref:Uncharacterized protein n=1 Tax=Rhynchophorus ferrugineus TaxID=354439 RepID=A0A834LZ59_RHYFE|nr:hypothetical protein GWI33_023062 [Rhynchophorus ferrugineus]
MLRPTSKTNEQLTLDDQNNIQRDPDCASLISWKPPRRHVSSDGPNVTPQRERIKNINRSKNSVALLTIRPDEL